MFFWIKKRFSSAGFSKRIFFCVSVNICITETHKNTFQASEKKQKSGAYASHVARGNENEICDDASLVFPSTNIRCGGWGVFRYHSGSKRILVIIFLSPIFLIEFKKIHSIYIKVRGQGGG